MRPHPSRPAARRLLVVLALLAPAIVVVSWWGLGEERAARREDRRAAPHDDPQAPTVGGQRATVELAPPPDARAGSGAGGAASAAERAGGPASARQPDARLDVRVHVQSGDLDAAELADIPVELRIAPRGRAELAPPLAAGRTDEAGIARFALPWSVVAAARAADPAPALSALTIASGWQRVASETDLPATPGVLEIALYLAPGVTLAGRVVDESGRGVPALVRARDPATAGLGALTGQAQARDDGTFEVHLRAPGVYEFSADAGDAGTAALAGRAVALGTEEFVLLEASGPGRLRGRVVGAGGEPAAGVELVARLEREGTAADGAQASAALHEPAHAAARGHALRRATTVLDGSFDLQGLRLERYRLHALSDRAGEEGQDLAPEGLLADGAPHVFVHARPHVVVRLLDARGEPVDAQRAPRPRDPERDGPGWPAEPRLTFEPLRGAPAVPRGVVLPGGACVYAVTAGASYRVTLAGGAYAPRSAHVDVPLDAGRVEVVLDLAPAELGWLAAVVADARGQADVRAWTLRVEDPWNGALVAVAAAEHASERDPLQLPAGRYRVVIDGAASTDRSAWQHRPRTGGRVEALVDVVAGQTAVVRAMLPSGGRLRLTIAGLVAEQEEAATQDLSPILPGDTSAQAWIEMVPVPELRLLDSERTPLPVRFYDDERAWSRGPRALQPGDSGPDKLSEPLPAGRYTLEAVLPDGRAARTPVVIVDGEVTHARLDFRD